MLYDLTRVKAILLLCRTELLNQNELKKMHIDAFPGLKCCKLPKCMLYDFHNPEIYDIRYLVVKFETILRFQTLELLLFVIKFLKYKF